MGAEVVRSFMFDATKAVSHEASDDWSPPFLPDTFDRVLLDAPCSALGQRPLFGNSITAKQLTSHPRLQKKLFDTVSKLILETTVEFCKFKIDWVVVVEETDWIAGLLVVAQRSKGCRIDPEIIQ